MSTTTATSAAQGKRNQRTESIERLRALLHEGSTVYTMVTHVSRSGMQRGIKVLVVQHGQIIDMSWRVADALQWSDHRSGGVKVNGCGMDMAFHTVYTLSQVLFGTDKGYALTQRAL